MRDIKRRRREWQLQRRNLEKTGQRAWLLCQIGSSYAAGIQRQLLPKRIKYAFAKRHQKWSAILIVKSPIKSFYCCTTQTRQQTWIYPTTHMTLST